MTKEIKDFKKENFYYFNEELKEWNTCEVLIQDSNEDVLEVIKVKDFYGKVSNKFFKLVNSINDFVEDGCVYKVKLI